MTNNLELARQYAEDVRDGRIEVNKYVKKAIERHYRDLDNAEARGWYFSDKSAEKAIKFYNFLALTKGVTRTTVPKDQINPDGSIRFQLAPWQAFAIASIFGWKKKENKKRRFNEVYIEIPKKNGKALALDTLIPTPSGWTTMGDIKVGDTIFDEYFRHTKVVATTEVMYGHVCYELTFSEGTKIVADAGHLWRTHDGLLTTEELTNDNLFLINVNQKGVLYLENKVEVETVPVRCIQVDSPSKLFLCSEGYIPTHNSTMASGFANYMLTADREAGPEVYFAAYSQDQAGICFDEAVAQIKDSKALRKIVKFFKYSVVTAKGRGKMMAVSHDGNNTEGKNSSAAVIDEYHVHKTDKVKDSLGTGMSARDQPILFVVTTAGYNKNGPCYQHRQMCIDMLEHGKEIDHIFTLIFGIDEDDDWQDEKNWVKANPTLGITTKISQIRNEFQVALRSGSKEVDFKTKRLNMWVDSAVTWIKSEYWKANFKKGEDGKKFIPPRGSWCYAGIDLGRSSDISAVCLYFPEYNYLMYKYYVAEDAAEYAARNGIDYNEWIRQGHLKTTPGRTTDYNIIHREIMEVTGEWDVKIIGYDPYGAQKFKDDLTEELGTIWVAKKQDDGSTKPDDYAIMQVVRQGFQTLGPATALFEKEVLDGTLMHDGNPITGWMLGNVQLAIDINGNMRPSKNKSADKIDGIAATCNALAVFSEWHKSIEESTGILAW